MNKQQFITELNQYLTFTTPEEHTAVITYYKDMLDNASPEDEVAILSKLETPMKLALCLRRRKDQGEDLCLLNGICEDDNEVEISEPQQEVIEEPVNEAEEEVCEESVKEKIEIFEDPPTATEDEIPEAEVSQEEVITETTSEPLQDEPKLEDEHCEIKEQAPDLNEEIDKICAELSTEESTEESIDDKDDDNCEDSAELSPPLPEEQQNDNAKSPVTAAYVFKCIGSVLLSIIIAVVSIPFIAGAIFLLASMGNFILAGLSSLHYTLDALMLFGGAFILGALGILIFWFFIWADIKLISKLFSGLKR